MQLCIFLSFIIPLESYGWQVRQAVKESFQLWQDEIANLDFEECPSCEENGDKEADIKIYFNKWKLIVWLAMFQTF